MISNQAQQKFLKLNNVRERLLFLAPTVQAGLDPESKLSDFTVQGDLGQGAFGKVLKATHNGTRQTYALKQISKKVLKQYNFVKQMTNELRIMYKMSHPYIIRLYTHFEDDDTVTLVLEFMKGGQLYQRLHKQPSRRFDERATAQYIREVVSALIYMHSLKIIHRDLKPENILIDETDKAKLADFGWSNFLEPNLRRQTYCGTVDYLAPEMLQPGHEHDQAVDVWSVGVLIFELLTGRSPFAPSGAGKLSKKEVETMTKDNISNGRLDMPLDFPVIARDLVTKILQKDPRRRLSLEEIKNHAWFSYNPLIRSNPFEVAGVKPKNGDSPKEQQNTSTQSPPKSAPQPPAQQTQPPAPVLPKVLQRPAPPQIRDLGEFDKKQEKILSKLNDMKLQILGDPDAIQFGTFDHDELKTVCRPDSILHVQPVDNRLDQVFADEDSSLQFSQSITVNHETRRIQELETKVAQLEAELALKNKEIKELKAEVQSHMNEQQRHRGRTIDENLRLEYDALRISYQKLEEELADFRSRGKGVYQARNSDVVREENQQLKDKLTEYQELLDRERAEFSRALERISKAYDGNTAAAREAELLNQIKDLQLKNSHLERKLVDKSSPK